ncbi:hypothetical protein KGQ29_04575 [Patescibacteria group bacterium]|nr:hypothetical protein [Patescibacteria group bacterium]
MSNPFEKTNNNFEERLDSISSNLDIIKKLLTGIELKLNADTVPTYNNNGFFDESLSLSQKAIYTLKQTGKFLSAREITKKIGFYEPSLLTSKDRFRTVYLNLSSILSLKTAQGKFSRYFPMEGGDFKYGLLSWVDEHGLPKKEYID